MVFSGMGNSGKIFKKEKKLIEFISENKDSISYCSTRNIGFKNVKYLTIKNFRV